MSFHNIDWRLLAMGVIAVSITVGCSPQPEGGDVDSADGADADAADVGAPCTFGETGVGVCDDGRRTASGGCRPPEAYESDEKTCDGLDNDCDGRRDERCDVDGDGFCREEKRVPADRPADVCPNGGGDCWDEAGSEAARRTYPGAAIKEGDETCALDRDDDEYGATRSQIPSRVRGEVTAGNDACDRQPRAWSSDACDSCADEDEDGYWAGCQTTLANPPDCDDGDDAIHPGATEACDGVDSDCDGNRDVDDPDADDYCESNYAEGVACRRDDAGRICCSRSGESC